jgi:hypothetical protein
MNQAMNQLKSTLLLLFSLAVYTSLSGQGAVVSPGCNITLDQGTFITIKNGFNMLLLDDNSTSPSFLEKGNLVFYDNGKAWVQQYVAKGIRHLVSSPVSDARINTYMNFYLYRWDEPTYKWINLYYPTTQPLVPGQGYSLYASVSVPDAPFIKGQPNRLDVPVTLSYTPGTYLPPSQYPGWNLIGNPFPCPLNWNGDPDWQLNGVDYTLYVKDPLATGYYLYNWYTGLGIGLDTGFVAATQGFMVKANTPGASLTLPASQRAHYDAVTFYKSGKQRPNTVRLTTEGQGSSSETLISFDEGATGAFDSRYDAYYLATDEARLELFSYLPDLAYAINFLPSWTEYPSVPVHLKSSENGLYTLTVTGIESFPDHVPIWLEDRKESFLQDLRMNPQYAFSCTAGDDESRFMIHFSNPLGTGESMTSDISIYSCQRTVFMDVPGDFGGDLYVYDLLGRLVLSRRVAAGHNSFEVPGEEAVYLVKIVSAERPVTKKIYLD